MSDRTAVREMLAWIVIWITLVVGIIGTMSMPANAATFLVGMGASVPTSPMPGDTVVFATGDHSVSLITLRTGVVYRGETGNRAAVRLHGATGNCHGAQATMCATSVNGVSIRDLTIDNAGAVGNGIVVGPGSTNVLVSNVRVTNVGLSPIVIGGVACNDSLPCTTERLVNAPLNITVADSEVDNGAKTGNGHGVFIRSCRSGVVLLNTRAHHMGTSGDPDGVHATNCPGLRITGGEFFANSEEGIDLSRTASNGNGCNDYMSGVCEVGGGRCLTDSDCSGPSCLPWIIEGARSFGNGVGGGGSGAIKVTSCAHRGIIRNNVLDANLQLDACPHDIAITGNRLAGLSLFGNNYGITVEGNVIQCQSASACVRVARGDAVGLHTSMVSSNEWRNNVVGNGLGSALSTGFQGVTSTAEYPSSSGAPRCLFQMGGTASRTYLTNQLAQFKTDAVFGPGSGDGDVWTTSPVSTTLVSTTSTSVTTNSTTSITVDPWSDLGHGVFTRRHLIPGPAPVCNQIYTMTGFSQSTGALAVGVCEP